MHHIYGHVGGVSWWMVDVWVDVWVESNGGLCSALSYANNDISFDN